MKGILTDERAQGGSRAVELVVFLAVLGIVGAVLTPVAINAIESDTTDTLTTDVGATDEVNAELNTTVDSVTAGSSATITLQSDGQSETNTINVGSNATYTFDRGEVDVNVTESTSANATAEYSYAKDYAYSSGASSLWGILGLGIVLVLFIFTIRQAL